MTLITRCLKTEIGTFNIFVNIIGAGLMPKHRHKNSHKVPAQTNFCVEEHWSMHPSGLFCTCNPLPATYISDGGSLPSWSACRKWTNSDPSDLWLVSFLCLFSWSETNFSKILLLSDKCLKWSSISALPFRSSCFSWFNFGTFGSLSCTGSIRRRIC